MIVDKESSWQPAGLVCLIHTMDSAHGNNINNNIKKKYHMALNHALEFGLGQDLVIS